MTHPSSSQILHSLEKYKQIHIFITGVPLAPKAVDSRGDELSLLGLCGSPVPQSFFRGHVGLPQS